MLKVFVFLSLIFLFPAHGSDPETDLKFIEIRLSLAGRHVQNLKFEDSNKVTAKNAMEHITPRTSMEGTNIHYYQVSFTENDIYYSCLVTFRDDPIRFTGYLTKMVGLTQCRIEVLASEQPVARCLFGYCL